MDVWMDGWMLTFLFLKHNAVLPPTFLEAENVLMRRSKKQSLTGMRE